MPRLILALSAGTARKVIHVPPVSSPRLHRVTTSSARRNAPLPSAAVLPPRLNAKPVTMAASSIQNARSRWDIAISSPLLGGLKAGRHPPRAISSHLRATSPTISPLHIRSRMAPHLTVRVHTCAHVFRWRERSSPLPRRLLHAPPGGHSSLAIARTIRFCGRLDRSAANSPSRNGHFRHTNIGPRRLYRTDHERATVAEPHFCG